MFGFFKKKKTPTELADHIYAEVLETLTQLRIFESLAYLHREALTSNITANEGNDLVMGAYRTMFLAAGLARQKAQSAALDEKIAESIANKILNDSSIRNITMMIRSSVPFTSAEPMIDVAKEAGPLFGAAQLFDELLRKGQRERAYKVWHECAKGAYGKIRSITETGV